MSDRMDNFVIRGGPDAPYLVHTLVLGTGLRLRGTQGELPELLGVKFMGAKVSLLGNVPIPTHTETPVPFDFQALDEGGYWVPSAGSRFTVPAGERGFYQVVARGVFGAGPAGLRVAGFRRNGTIAGLARVDSTSSSIPATAIEVLFLEEGDVLEMLVHQESGAALPLIGGQPYESSFMITRLG